jgi:hypothetical protein
MSKVFEIVSYRLNNDGQENEFLQASNKVQTEVMPKTKGFIGRKVLKNADGRFCDIVMWESMEDAHNAMEAVMQSEICLAMFAFIDQESIEMNHFEILSASHENLDFEAGAVEIGTTKLKDGVAVCDPVSWSEIVREKYLQKQSGFVAQFSIQKEDGTYGEVVFNKNDIKESEQICSGYFSDENCQKYISHFDPETTNLGYWTVL